LLFIVPVHCSIRTCLFLLSPFLVYRFLLPGVYTRLLSLFCACPKVSFPLTGQNPKCAGKINASCRVVNRVPNLSTCLSVHLMGNGGNRTILLQLRLDFHFLLGTRLFCYDFCTHLFSYALRNNFEFCSLFMFYRTAQRIFFVRLEVSCFLDTVIFFLALFGIRFSLLSRG